MDKQTFTGWNMVWTLGARGFFSGPIFNEEKLDLYQILQRNRARIAEEAKGGGDEKR